MGSVMGSESTGNSRSATGTNGGGDGKGPTTYSRRAHHAGSWYEDDAAALRRDLDSYLREALEHMPSLGFDVGSSGSGLRGVIVPHAGYRYSGRTAAYAYAALRRHIEAVGNAQAAASNAGGSNIVIVVLHPSHHVYLEGCAVSAAHELQTPLGRLAVDDKLRAEVLRLTTGSAPRAQTMPGFTLMSQRDDEHEHSGEMQYPFLAHALASVPKGAVAATIVPIMVGSISPDQEERFGKLLAPILARPNVLTVVSSDFCHWGSRFSYRPTPQSSTPQLSTAATAKATTPIHEFISQLDRDGMDLIERQQPGAFARYLKETRNTICGRHPISVWLNAITAAPGGGGPIDVQFVKYAQSSAVTAMHESSVSYAAALATLKQS